MVKNMQEHQMESEHPGPLSEVAELRRLNFEKFKKLIHREIEISSSAYQGTARVYYVEDVREVTIDIGSGFVPGVRLINRREPVDAQPTLKFPTEDIIMDEDDDEVEMLLRYSYEPNIVRSFRHLYKKSRPDMVIKIKYVKKKS